MADVAEAFARGRGFAQNEQIHQQQTEENKLRMMVLKHQIDGMKIEDKLRQRAIEQQNLELMTGQPEATRQQPNLPSTSSAAGGMTGLPDVVSSLIEARNGGAAGPTTLPAPAAQATTPGSNTVSVPNKPMKISGVPEWGIPDINPTPRSAEDIVRASIAAKMMEPYTLSRGQVRGVGSQVIARGEPPAETRLDVGKRAAAGDQSAKAQLAAAYPQRASTATNLSGNPQDVLLDGKPAKVRYGRDGKVYDLDNNEITNSATRVTRAPNTGSPTAERRADQADAAAERAEYADFYRDWTRRYPGLSATERMQQSSAKEMNKNLPADKQLPTLPEPPAPPSLPKWKVMTDEERQAVLADPSARITDAEMKKRQAAGAKQPSNGGQKAAGDKTPKEAAGSSSKRFSAQEVAGFLKGKEPAAGKIRKITLTDGTVWNLFPDGQYEQVLEK